MIKHSGLIVVIYSQTYPRWSTRAETPRHLPYLRFLLCGHNLAWLCNSSLKIIHVSADRPAAPPLHLNLDFRVLHNGCALLFLLQVFPHMYIHTRLNNSQLPFPRHHSYLPRNIQPLEIVFNPERPKAAPWYRLLFLLHLSILSQALCICFSYLHSSDLSLLFIYAGDDYRQGEWPASPPLSDIRHHQI